HEQGVCEARRRAGECRAVLAKLASRDLEAAAIRLLRDRRSAGTCAVLLRILPSIRDAGVEEEIHVTLFELGMNAGEAEEVLLKGLSDPAAARRGAAALVIGWAGGGRQGDRAWELGRAGPVSAVRLRAARGLIAGGDVKAVPALLPLLTEAPFDVAEQTWRLLGTVAGEGRPRRLLVPGEMPGEDESPLDQAASRARCRAEWEKW